MGVLVMGGNGPGHGLVMGVVMGGHGPGHGPIPLNTRILGWVVMGGHGPGHGRAHTITTITRPFRAW